MEKPTTTNSLEFWRQLDVITPELAASTPINVIGAGAIGSWVAFMLGKMGFTSMTLWDFDIISDHNIPNQFFKVSEVGDYKVSCLANTVKDFANFKPRVKNIAYEGQSLSGIVVIAVDSMKVRKDIYEKIMLMKDVIFVAEGRLDAFEHQAHFNTRDTIESLLNDKNLFYTDKEADNAPSACTSLSCCITAAQLSSIMIWGIVNFLNGRKVPKAIFTGCKNFTQTVIGYQEEKCINLSE